MPPEQRGLTGRRVGAPSGPFSLGAVLYALLTVPSAVQVRGRAADRLLLSIGAQVRFGPARSGAAPRRARLSASAPKRWPPILTTVRPTLTFRDRARTFVSAAAPFGGGTVSLGGGCSAGGVGWIRFSVSFPRPAPGLCDRLASECERGCIAMATVDSGRARRRAVRTTTRSTRGLGL